MTKSSSAIKQTRWRRLPATLSHFRLNTNTNVCVPDVPSDLQMETVHTSFCRLPFLTESESRSMMNLVLTTFLEDEAYQYAEFLNEEMRVHNYMRALGRCSTGDWRMFKSPSTRSRSTPSRCHGSST
ncbi:hypothetical protein J6590_029601 [Homalodisca vitripennis]|nr:hypothetical protein J6590_029601 [Homalodisca vitripennis]